MSDFPRLVYKSPGRHQLPGGSYDHKCVEDEDEYNQAVVDGWFGTVPEALGGTSEPDDSGDGTDIRDEDLDDAPVTREELEHKAKELGIKFSNKTTDKKLGDMIRNKIAPEA